MTKLIELIDCKVGAIVARSFSDVQNENNTEAHDDYEIIIHNIKENASIIFEIGKWKEHFRLITGMKNDEIETAGINEGNFIFRLNEDPKLDKYHFFVGVDKKHQNNKRKRLIIGYEKTDVKHKFYVGDWKDNFHLLNKPDSDVKKYGYESFTNELNIVINAKMQSAISISHDTERIRTKNKNIADARPKIAEEMKSKFIETYDVSEYEYDAVCDIVLKTFSPDRSSYASAPYYEQLMVNMIVYQRGLETYVDIKRDKNK